MGVISGVATKRADACILCLLLSFLKDF